MDTTDRITRVNLTLDHDYQFIATYPDLPLSSSVVVDEPPPLGQGHGPNPVALLATAVGNCLASSLLFCARKARVPIGDIQVTAEAHIARNAVGRLRLQRLHVTVVPTLPTADHERLERCQRLFEDFCIVTAAVRDGIDVEVTVAPRAAREPVGEMAVLQP